MLTRQMKSGKRNAHSLAAFGSRYFYPLGVSLLGMERNQTRYTESGRRAGLVGIVHNPARFFGLIEARY
jgi:hypothetical protein